MNHWVIAPVILPLLVAVLLLLSQRLWLQRACTVAGAVMGVVLVGWLVNRSRFDGMETYLPGNLMPPLGPVLVLDKLATLMLAITALLHLATVAQGLLAGHDRNRPALPVLQQVLLAGVNGSVLAGDLVSLWLCWTMALVALAGLMPPLWRLAVAGSVALAVGLGLAIWQGGSANLATLADQGATAGGLGLAIAVLALWGAGMWVLVQVPMAAAAGLAAAGIAGRMVTMVPLGLWLYPVAIGMALAVALMLASRWNHSRVQILVGLGGTAALSLMAVGSVSLTLVGIWLLVAAGLLALSAQVLAVGAAAPPLWRRWVTGGIGLCLVVALVSATLLPGKIPARVASQFDAIARQLHQPLIYITAVIGLPDQPALAPDPSP